MSTQDNNDDEDDKYFKVKESKDSLFRRIFMFIAVSFMVTTYVCFDDSISGTDSDGSVHLKDSKIRSIMRAIKKDRKKGRNGAITGGFNKKKGDTDLLNDGVVKHNLDKGGLDKQGAESMIEPSLEKLEQKRMKLDQQVRSIKATGIIMETDEESLEVTKALQDITRQVLKKKYGDHANYRVKVDLEFQSSLPDFKENGPHGTLVIEMAPIQYIPVSVYNWLEIARTWKSGAFHRNANHVLQATTNSAAVKSPLAFQEYSDKHPHKKGTVGYCGRPSGPCWYVNIIDNSKNHGPGSQQKKNPHEADGNFGRIVSGMDDVVPRIHSVPQKSWLDKKNQVFIKTMTILVPTGSGGAFTEWVP